MNHPAKHGLTYLQHLRRASSNAARLAYASVVLAVHGVIPSWFEYTASDVVRWLAARMARDPSESTVLIRFNRRWREDPYQRRWRVIENGHEMLANRVKITVPCVTSDDPIVVGDDPKYHLKCRGRVTSWSDGTVEVS